MQSRPHVCAGCSTGCSIWIDENQDHIYRLKPRENPRVNQWWMCDDGRYGFHYVHDLRRQTQPRVRKPGEQPQTIEWSLLTTQLTAELQAAGHLAVLLSPFLTVEEAYLLADTIRRIDPDALVGLGPIPLVGEDESFPNGFTIRAEKCPNRRGIEKIVASFDGLVDFDQWVQRLSTEQVAAVWVTGGYPQEWHTAEIADRIAAGRTVIVQDLFDSALWQAANYQLPGAAYPERSGSFVNHNDHLQSFDWAIRPPAGVMTEGQLLWRMNDRTGLYRHAIVMREIAARIGYFSAALEGVPAQGLDLKVNLLAGV
jgi:NADH-quinone oxidoreductase subunit G